MKIVADLEKLGAEFVAGFVHSRGSWGQWACGSGLIPRSYALRPRISTTAPRTNHSDRLAPLLLGCSMTYSPFYEWLAAS